MLSTSITDTQGIVAIAAVAIALIALGACIALGASLRRLRRDQRAVLGDERRDLVAHAATLQDAFDALHDYVSDVSQTLDARLSEVEQSLLYTISQRSLLHYDAYNEFSGRQSMSIALLDGTRSGIVLTCIHHRDQARVYAKHVVEGQGTRELSPEEAEAVRTASTAPAQGDVPEPAR